jgi:sugar/nucleoside kinase (ribokinase family)
MILVMGDLVDDIVVRPLGEVNAASDTDAEIRLEAGGSAANVAAWLGRLGAPVRFLGRAGRWGADRHRAELARFGVDARVVADPELTTATIVLTVDPAGERTMYVDRGANAAFGPEDVPADAWDDVDWLHLTGYSLFDPGVRPVALDLARHATEAGIGWSLDPSSLGFLEDAGAEVFLGWAAGAGVLFPNLDEGRFLSGLVDPEEAARKLAGGHREVVLKLGAEGSLLARGDRVVRVPAEPTRVVDTTGAGDAFCAGFLAARHAGGADRECLEAGAGAAAVAVTRLGARPA